MHKWEEGQKEPNQRWKVEEADPHNAEATEGGGAAPGAD